ncbi:MAG: D-aminoacyl-tRNA deacylase [Candidatus Omnitrophota bacterium]
MRAVIQRVNSASVIVEGKTVGRIHKGLVIFLGVVKEDTQAQAIQLAEKVAELRIFSDPQRKMNISIKEAAGEVLVVSQFTICADLDHGRRPSFDRAAEPKLAEQLYREFIHHLQGLHLKVEEGIFKAYMIVHIENDGPVTFILDTEKGL